MPTQELLAQGIVSRICKKFFGGISRPEVESDEESALPRRPSRQSVNDEFNPVLDRSQLNAASLGLFDRFKEAGFQRSNSKDTASASELDAAALRAFIQEHASQIFSDRRKSKLSRPLGFEFTQLIIDEIRLLVIDEIRLLALQPGPILQRLQLVDELAKVLDQEIFDNLSSRDRKAFENLLQGVVIRLAFATVAGPEGNRILWPLQLRLTKLSEPPER